MTLGNTLLDSDVDVIESSKVRAHQNQPNGIRWCHFHLHISHKAVKSMAKLISQSCGELQPGVCLPRGYAAI